MIAWIWKLIVGDFCKHEWQEYGRGKTYIGHEQCGYYFVLKCKKCGNMKNHTI